MALKDDDYAMAVGLCLACGLAYMVVLLMAACAAVGRVR